MMTSSAAIRPFIGKKAQARRQIYQNVIVLVPHAIQKFSQKIFALRQADELHERAREMWRRGNKMVVVDLTWQDNLLMRRLSDHPVINAFTCCAGAGAEAPRLIIAERRTCVCLRIEINEQYAPASERQICAEVHGRGRFSDAALSDCKLR